MPALPRYLFAKSETAATVVGACGAIALKNTFLESVFGLPDFR
jgi:hypothetical protein